MKPYESMIGSPCPPAPKHAIRVVRIRDDVPPEDHDEFVALRATGFTAIRSDLTGRRRKKADE